MVIPALETLGFGVLPIVALGTADQQKALLEGIEDGRILTAALAEPGARFRSNYRAPRRRDDDRHRHLGATARRARSVLVPVSTAGGAPVLVVVAPDAPGVTLTPTLESLGVPEYAMRFDATPVDDDGCSAAQGTDRSSTTSDDSSCRRCLPQWPAWSRGVGT